MNTSNMGRPHKLSSAAVQQASVDRRNGMTWHALSVKYDCAINTIRDALMRYSDEFNPTDPTQRSELSRRLDDTESKLEKIEKVLKKRFNLHI